MHRLMHKIILLGIALTLIILITPAMADMGPPAPWGTLEDRYDRDSIIDLVRHGGSHPQVWSVLLDHAIGGVGSEMVDSTKLNQIQDLMNNARVSSRTRLSIFWKK